MGAADAANAAAAVADDESTRFARAPSMIVLAWPGHSVDSDLLGTRGGVLVD